MEHSIFQSFSVQIYFKCNFKVLVSLAEKGSQATLENEKF